MPPDRFDDVEFRIIDAPDPRPPRRRRRWLAAGAGAILAAGALAAGASALTGGDDAAPAAKPPADGSWSPYRGDHHGHGCRHHGGDRGTTSDASKL
jgi:hypothetical protein